MILLGWGGNISFPEIRNLGIHSYLVIEKTRSKVQGRFERVPIVLLTQLNACWLPKRITIHWQKTESKRKQSKKSFGRPSEAKRDFTHFSATFLCENVMADLEL